MRTSEWAFDPARIGFMGFSAGGEVAALLETRFDAGDPTAADPVERFSSRPGFSLVIYPGFRPDAIGDIPKDAPPAFLATLSCETDGDAQHAAAVVTFKTSISLRLSLRVSVASVGRGKVIDLRLDRVSRTGRAGKS